MKQAFLYTIRPMEPNELYARQEMYMETYCKEQNIQIIEKFSDIGYPASNLKRPALNEMIKRISGNHTKIELVLFYGIERFEKDIARLEYVESIIKRYVKEIRFIHDSVFIEDMYSGRRTMPNE